jgi:paraquat-inducible protein A
MPRIVSALAILASTAILVVSLTLPTVTFDTLGSEQEIYSIYGGIESLWVDGNWILASIVFLFSMVFPVAKLLALSALWFGCGRGSQRLGALHWLQLLGKWSLLDVFVIAVFVSAIQLGIATATSRLGIQVFCLAILLSMLSTILMTQFELGSQPRDLRPQPRLAGWGPRLLTCAAAASLGMALATTLLTVSRKVAFVSFENQIDLVHTTASMARGGELFLGVALGVFVVAAPVLRSLFALRLRWLPGAGARTRRAVMVLDEWAMLDVFGLGLAIVYVKLAELSTTTLMAGFWWVIAAGVLTVLDAWVLRRQILPGSESHEPLNG